jgi:hypothetical protein
VAGVPAAYRIHSSLRAWHHLLLFTVAWTQQGKMREMALTALLFAVAVAHLHQSQAQEAVTQGAPFAFALSRISSVCAVG